LETKLETKLKTNELIDISRESGTPSYVFDMRSIMEILELCKKAAPSADYCYAMKANPFIVKYASEFAKRIEVCSPGEYEICVREGVELEKIIVSGVNKTVASIDRILDYSKGKGIYTIESTLHYEILEELAAGKNLKLKVLIRLTNGSQFGVSKQEYFDILKKVTESDNLEFIGVHYFSGTQKKLKKIEKELIMLTEFATELKEKFGIENPELEYGPGLCVNYFETDNNMDQLSELTCFEELLKTLNGYSKVTVEMGRFIASMCGYFVTKVIDIKHNEDSNFLIVDGGIHQLNYYGQMVGMKKPFIRHYSLGDDIKGDVGEKSYTVCGSLCSLNDVIVRDLSLTDVKYGDYLIFERCGAYSVTEGMALFLSRELPAVTLITVDGEKKLLRRITETNIFNSEMK